MSEEDLEVLITLDDPEGAPEVDTFHHHSSKNTIEYSLDKPPDEQTEAVGQPPPHKC